MFANTFKTLQCLSETFKFLSVRLYSRPAVHNINLNRNVTLDGDSQHVQYLKYIGISNAKDYNTEKSKIKYSEFFPITDPRILKQNISEVEIPDFPTLINFLYTYNTRAQPNNVLSCINLIERETCAKLDVMDSKTMFNILFAYMFLIPGYTHQLKFYENVMMKLTDRIDSLSKHHLIQYGFYLGLSKTSNPQYTNIMKNVLLVLADKYLDEITLDDLCIISNAAFKMSVKVNSVDMLDFISHTLITGINENNLDTPRIITLLKSLRLTRYFSNELLQSLSQFILSHGDDFNVTAISHILPYYADNYYIDEEAINQLVNKFLTGIANESSNIDMYESNNVRGKDLTRFLWALSYLGWTLEPKTYEMIENIILDKMSHDDYRNNTDDLFNASLSLCTMNYIPKRLLRVLLSDRFINTRSSNSRSEERKRLLFSILNIEYSEVYEDVPQLLNYWNSIKNIHTEPMTKDRKNLQQVLNVVSNCDFGLKNIQLRCQIPFLNTPGITATDEKNNTTVHIEVMDEGVCIKNSSKPNGIMQLKLRLLRSLPKSDVILINKEDVENKVEDHIKSVLEAKMARCQ